MDGFIDCLDQNVWKEVSASDLEGTFVEFNVSKKHDQVNPTTWKFALTNDNSDMKAVTIEGCIKDPMTLNKLPLNKCEFRFSEDGTKITGINLDDMDCVVLK